MYVPRSKGAPPIMQREKHPFKIVTIYVVDKLNFNLQKLRRMREIENNMKHGGKISEK
mgnify:CR=1 FL=1